MTPIYEPDGTVRSHHDGSIISRPLATSRSASDLAPGTVVATLRTPLPIGDALVTATRALERVYGTALYLLPMEPHDEFVQIATAS